MLPPLGRMNLRSTASRAVILLVEDEPLVRLVGADLLEEAGFEVVEAADGDEALSILETRPDVQVLFTDINMPGSLDGLELARVVHERWPDVHLLVTSGRFQLRSDDIPNAGQFVAKPYEPAAVIRKLRAMLH